MPDTKTSLSDYLKMRTTARLRQDQWDAYVLQYPELANVKTQEDFYIARFKNQKIPITAWAIKEEAETLTAESNASLNPLNNRDDTPKVTVPKASNPDDEETESEEANPEDAPSQEAGNDDTQTPTISDPTPSTTLPEINIPESTADNTDTISQTPPQEDQPASDPIPASPPVAVPTPINESVDRTSVVNLSPSTPIARVVTPQPVTPTQASGSTQTPPSSSSKRKSDGNPYQSVHSYLQREWGKTYNLLQQKVLNQKIQEFTELYKGQVHRNADGTTIPLAEFKISEYQNKRFPKIASEITADAPTESPLQQDARKAFREEYQKEWHPAESVSTESGDIEMLPSYVTGITDEEIAEAQEILKDLPSESDDGESTPEDYPVFPQAPQNQPQRDTSDNQPSLPQRPDISRRISVRNPNASEPFQGYRTRRPDPRFRQRSRGINGKLNRIASRLRARPPLGQLRSLQKARQVVQLARLAPLVTNPIFWIVLGIILILLFFFFMMSRNSMSNSLQDYGATAPEPTPVTPPPGAGEPTIPAVPIPNLNLEKSAGAQVNNGEDILYTLSVRYGGDLDVTIYDAIPEGTEYVNASGEKTVDNATGLVSWRLGANTPTRSNESQAEDIYTFTLTVRPTQNDITVENLAYATAPGGTTGPAPETNDFNTLMAGQGRNTQILGDENSFVNTAYTNLNNDNRLDDGDRARYEEAFRKIYRKATEHKINPAIFIAIWGVESSITFNGTEFGCKPFGSGFDEQLRCGVEDALGRLMDQFDRIVAQDGLPVPYTNEQTCMFNDPFLYAYEGYTPVCTMNDSNDHARTNFVIYYKLTLYGEY